MIYLTEIIGLLWAMCCFLVLLLGVAHFVLYYKDIKWKRKTYLYELLDEGYEIQLVKKGAGASHDAQGKG